MPHRQPSIRSDIARSTTDTITVRGRSLPDQILGHMDLATFSYLQLTGHEASPEQARVYNALLIALVEHGLTPSVLAARLTYAGAPEAIQAAIAAGLAGLGNVFVGSTEGAARLLSEGVKNCPRDGSLGTVAERIVADHLDAGLLLPGIGHPLHKPIDPRTPRLWQIAKENGLHGSYVELMNLISVTAERRTGRSLPVNATGAVAALACELGLPWRIVRGLGVMARAIGLVGHILEESENPIATEIWRRTDQEASAHQ